MTRPARLRLSRARGFDLQAVSIATNDLPAVNVARPSRWGNPVTREDFDLVNNVLRHSGIEPLRGTWQEHAVKCFEGWIGGAIPEMGEPPTVEMITTELRGKNLACWCAPSDPCHADVLIALANGPRCDEVPA